MFANTFNCLERATKKAGHKPAAAGGRRASGRAAAPALPPWRRPGRRLLPGRRPARLLSKPAAFLRSRRGGTVIESALAISVLVIVCGGLMAIAHAAYTDDRMSRAARAAARAVALVTDTSASQGALAAVACNAIRRELGLDAEFDCAGAWTITIDTDLTPSALAGGSTIDGEAGDMVRVEIGWLSAPWARTTDPLQESEEKTAVGLARGEPAG